MRVSTDLGRLHPRQSMILAIGEWECMECGHHEAGAVGRAPGRCPACGARSDMLAFFDYFEDYYVPRGGFLMAEELTTQVEGEWECDECGYVYVRQGEADKPPTKPCPECGAPASKATFYEYPDDDWDDEENL